MIRTRQRLAMLGCAAVLMGTANDAQARDGRRYFDVPAGSLVSAIIRIAEQSGVSIGTAERGVPQVRVRAVRGWMTVDAALSRLLAGTEYEAIRIDDATIRIQRVRFQPPRPARPGKSSSASPSGPETAAKEIVVTASKQGLLLGDYSGSAIVLTLDHPGQESRGTAAIVDQLPFVATTSLGAGRDKLFIRGIADSSFSGPTKATIGQYLGEARLTYNMPDPNLHLYDMERIEVLEGPQGALYGAGALGGIVKLMPHQPVIGQWEGSFSGGVVSVSHGGAGGDAAGMLNVPLGTFAAARFVGYHVLRPGYINDLQRGRNDVNRTRLSGGRGSLRIAPGAGWTIDIGSLYQMIDSADGQYSETTAPPLSRRSAIAEPASSRYFLGQVVIRKSWSSGVELVSSSNLVRHRIAERYDATERGPVIVPMANDIDGRALLFSQEARLSRTLSGGGGWVLGANLIVDSRRVTNRLSAQQLPDLAIGINGHTVEGALFGEATLPLGKRWQATVGGRLTMGEMSTNVVLLTEDEFAFDQGRSRLGFLPMAALSYHIAPGTIGFVRYQQGYRAGGVAVGQDNISRFHSDTLRMLEAGVRFGQAGQAVLSGSAALSYSNWSNIQADLNGPSGPHTANIGSGKIIGFEALLEWRPVPSLALSGALFLTDSDLTDPAEGLDRARRDSLPNTPDITARAGVDYRIPISDDRALSFHGAARYVGRSWLGAGSELHIPQGRYIDTSFGIEGTYRNMSVSLDISNLLDERGNRFAFGNPFRVAEGSQETPLQPRTVRIGVRTRF